MNTLRPKISIVVTARNDDHGGGFLHRMQIFITALMAQCDRHKLKAELIIVEWNPPEDRPGLPRVLTWPEESGYCTVRIIEVPPEIHNRYKYAQKLPLYQMIAKNVGIRRSRSDYVLATNIDVIFSDELMQFLASGTLSEGVLYRIDRTDVPENVPLDATINEQLEFCLYNIIRINCREGTHHKLTGRYYASYGHLDVVLTNLHFNACGDFTLMSRKDWERLNGYPEFDMYSPHLDSLMLIIAYYAGIHQEILSDPMRLYHLEHGGAWIAENASKLEKEKKSEEIPVLKLSQFEEWTSEMRETGKPIIFNDQNWGFINDHLNDEKVEPAYWESSTDSIVSIEESFGEIINMDDTHAEKSILIITEGFPVFDSDSRDNFYQIIRSLNKYHKIVLVSRKGIEKGKYIEHLRKLGVIVFYDEESLMEQTSLDGSTDHQYTTLVSVKKIFKHYTFNIVLFGSSHISSLYLSTIKKMSPRSRLIISALEQSKGQSNDRIDDAYVFEKADLVIASADTAEVLAEKMPDQNISIISESKDQEIMEDQILNAVNNPLGHANKEIERFRLFTDKKAGSALWAETADLTVIFVMNEDNDTSLSSLQAMFGYSHSSLTNIIVALHGKRCAHMRNQLEAELRYYFTYDNETELNNCINRISRECSGTYISVVEDNVIVCPGWDIRLLTHLKKDPGINIITARPSDVLYDSMYDFEADADRAFKSERGIKKLSRKVNAPCLIMRRSSISSKQGLDLKDQLGNMLTHKLVYEAQDTLVFYVKKGLKKVHEVTFDKPVNKTLSVIIPVFNDHERIPASLNSLFMQKDVNYEDIEIIVVCSGPDRETIELLNGITSPCSFRHYEIEDRGLSAALNYGIRKASGEYILFLSEEADAREGLLHEHISTHVKHKKKAIAVLGHISLSRDNNSNPFMKFISKNPKLPFASPLVYNFNDIGDPDNAGHFYLPNISVKKQILQDLGVFDEKLTDEWTCVEFGSRYAIKGHKVIYRKEAAIHLNFSINLNDFLNKQKSGGSQFAVMTYAHPDIWNIKGARSQCLYNYFDKQGLIQIVKDAADELESISADDCEHYRFGGMFLLEKSYYLLSNYYFAEGINSIICEREGNEWLAAYAEETGSGIEDIACKNRAYEILFKGYWSLGKGDDQAFSGYIEELSNKMEEHPSAYYAAGKYYFDMNEYRLAEDTFEQGVGLRKRFKKDLIFPAEDEAIYSIWLAMACIPQGKYKKAAAVLEELIAERLNLSDEQEALMYKCLDMSYRGTGGQRKAEFCKQEVIRLEENIKSKQEFQSLESVSI